MQHTLPSSRHRVSLAGGHVNYVMKAAGRGKRINTRHSEHSNKL